MSDRPQPGSHGGPADPTVVLADGVLVVGAGLIGTSIGMALVRAGVPVHLTDRDPGQAALAADLGAGTAGVPERDPALIVAAVPALDVPPVITDLGRRYLSSSLTDVSSVKSHVQVDIEAESGIAVRFVGGHPMAGRERSGAAVADPDLFDGRTWVLTPGSSSGAAALERVQALALACSADPVTTDPARHDVAVALVSHAPQVVASLMAARLVGAADDLVGLAGPGIRDVTRIAASDPALWTGILAANAEAVVPVLDAFAADLDELRGALALEIDRSMSQDSDVSTNSPSRTITDLLDAGVRGRERLPGKHGGRPADYTVVQVVVSDQPGQLARLFTAADEVGINIEDVSIEHAPGHPVGVVELMVAPEAASELATALRERGWSVHH